MYGFEGEVRSKYPFFYVCVFVCVCAYVCRCIICEFSFQHVGTMYNVLACIQYKSQFNIIKLQLVLNLTAWQQLGLAFLVFCFEFKCFCLLHDFSVLSLTSNRFSTQMAGLFTEVFNWLPLAHCINNKVLVGHHSFLLLAQMQIALTVLVFFSWSTFLHK